MCEREDFFFFFCYYRRFARVDFLLLSFSRLEHSRNIKKNKNEELRGSPCNDCDDDDDDDDDDDARHGFFVRGAKR